MRRLTSHPSNAFFGETIMHDSHFELLIAVVAIVMTVLLYRLAIL